MVQRLMSSTIAAALLAITTSSAFAVDAGAISQESSSQWRASKLAGVPIYGPGNKTVGKISDILVSKDGKAEYVVIGVGGFLGIGEKDVAIPYDQVKFTDQPMMPPANPEPVNNNMAAPAANGARTGASAGMAPNSGAPATTVGLGTPAETSGNATVPAMAGTGMAPGNMAPGTMAPGTMSGMPRSMAYPDHGTIDMTADQLKGAPAFKFAS